MAIRAHNLLANGMGGIDWSGLPVAMAYLGISDVEPFLQALEVVLNHRPPNPDGSAAGDD